MSNPIPFGLLTLNNSPLENEKPGIAKSGFPCKQRKGVYDITERNKIAAGSVHDSQFSGTAPHGGGTCQLAVSMDREPTVNSTWKLIKVMEGGCPSSRVDTTDIFTFTIPTNFPNGLATFIWTWYNRLGSVVYKCCS